MATTATKRRQAGHATDRAVRTPEGEKRVRKTIDYSYGGDPIAAEPPISVQDDELLQRLREGLK